MAAKVFSAPLGYSFDRARGRHVFAFREEVPSWWSLRKRGGFSLWFGLASFLIAPRKQIPFAIIGTLAGAFYVDVWPWWPFGALVGGIAGFYLGKFLSRNAAPPLTGKPGLGGMVTDFQAQVEVDDRGNAELARELYASDPKMRKKYAPAAFHISDVVSIERQTWAETFPDRNRNPTGDAAKKNLKEVRNRQRVILVFGDGQSIDAGWKDGDNQAARLQSDLISFFGQVKGAQDRRRADSDRLARIAPDDEPL